MFSSLESINNDDINNNANNKYTCITTVDSDYNNNYNNGMPTLSTYFTYQQANKKKTCSRLSLLPVIMIVLLL